MNFTILCFFQIFFATFLSESLFGTHYISLLKTISKNVLINPPQGDRKFGRSGGGRDSPFLCIRRLAMFFVDGSIA